MKNGFPTLMLIRAGGHDTTTYLGPTDLESLVEFVNEATPKEPAPSLKFKVNKKLNILDQEEKYWGTFQYFVLVHKHDNRFHRMN